MSNNNNNNNLAISSTTNSMTPMINYSSLQYLLNETIAHSIRSTITHYSISNNSESTNSKSINNYLSNIENVNSSFTLSYINEIGFNVGYKTSQTLLLNPTSSTMTISNLSNTALIDNPLEAMKFICRDVWKNLFGKQMDNLRTNHIGTFVLVDNKPICYSNCCYITALEIDETISRASPYIEFNAGLIHGVLASLGISVITVTASPNEITDSTSSTSSTSSSTSQFNGVIYTVETK
jgi:hypothetical protein